MSVLKVCFKGCFLKTLAAMIVAASCGTFAGYRLACDITIKKTHNQLDRFATRFLDDGEASSSELHAVLASLGASRHNVCSDEEIGYFRSLIFNSKYLKDAGRMRNGKIECSAILGRQTSLRAQPEPDFTLPNEMKIYKSLPPYRKSNQTTIALELGEFYVVFSPLARMPPGVKSIHYTETVIDVTTQESGQLFGDLPQTGGKFFTTEGFVQTGGALYLTKCSKRFPTCFSVYTTMLEAKQIHRNVFIGYIALFRVLGGLTGLGLSLLYHRNKSIPRQLYRAIRKNQLRLVYQPIVNAASGQIVGAESLVRWTNQEGTDVDPDVFIKIAEEQGFVGEITRFVVRHALDDFAEILREHREFRLSINVATADLTDPTFLPMLSRSLDETAVPARSLAIEITEGSTVRHEVAIETIRRLREKGHRVHIDDFGTGYSSLAYLHELSVDAIKIDRSFTKTIGTGSAIVAILPQILAMAEALNLQVIAEGVETEEQASYFANQDRPILAQGWLFGRPVPAEEFHRILAEDEKKIELPSEVLS